MGEKGNVQSEMQPPQRSRRGQCVRVGKGREEWRVNVLEVKKGPYRKDKVLEFKEGRTPVSPFCSVKPLKLVLDVFEWQSAFWRGRQASQPAFSEAQFP